jgi:hypothetical protein
MNLTTRTIRHMGHPDQRFYVRHHNQSSDTWTLERLDGPDKGEAVAVRLNPAAYEVYGPDGWARLPWVGDTPVTETLVNGRTQQDATVYGAGTFAGLRDLGYRLGLCWFQACAVAAYVVERHPREALNVLQNRYGHFKDECWYDRDRGIFWKDFYGQQPSHPRY